MTRRRGHGEGSVYRRPEGGWAGTVEIGRDPSGRRRRKVVKARTKGEVLDALEQVRRNVADGLPVVDQRRATADYLYWWADTALPGTVKESTAADYRQVIRRYLEPSLGSVPLAKLGPQHVRAMLADLDHRGLSPATQRYARAVLRRALGQAEAWGLVARNVASIVEGPRKATTRLDDALEASEAQAVLDAAAGDRLEAFAYLILTLGLRRGEALALRWSNVDLDRGEVTIAGTLSRRPGVGLVIDTPKTAAAARTIPLVAGLTDVMKEHRRRQAQERLAASWWAEDDFVFTSPVGTPLDPSNVLRWWHELTIRAGIGRRRIHAARHTAATLLLDRDVPLEVVSAILGHASLSITADVYARVSADSKRRALSTLDVLYRTVS